MLCVCVVDVRWLLCFLFVLYCGAVGARLWEV